MMGNKRHPNPRRLIVDTDLGLDDLVALAILRVQQCLIGSGDDGNGDRTHDPHHSHHHRRRRRPPVFHIAGVTLTSGISPANTQQSVLLRRILPPGTPVFVSGGNDNTIDALSSSSLASSSNPSHHKPIWWTRTANRVSSFLSSLPPCHLTHEDDIAIMSAEQFIASNMDDPNVDFLCLAPLSSVARALCLRSSFTSTSSAPKASFYIMGGIQSESKVTKRGESTSPFGYNDPINSQGRDEHQELSKGCDNFGEFNFALDIHAARTVLSTVPGIRLIPLESCTLVPVPLRPKTDKRSDTTMLPLLSVLKDILPNDSDSASELHVARNNLRLLLAEFGTTETQWDSIAAALYCNAFDNSDSCKRLDSREITISDLGEISITSPTNQEDDERKSPASLWVFPTFTIEDESKFVRYLELLLKS